MEEAKQKELHRLEKMTITKMREEAMEKYPDLHGVHGMEKEKLIEEICKIEKIPYHTKETETEDHHKKRIRLKKNIKDLRAKKDELQGKELKKQRTILRKKIKTTKRNLRKVA